MVNPTGKNGVDNGVFPPDDELKEILHDFQRRGLSLAIRLRYLEEKHGMKIGSTKLKKLNKKFEVPSARKFNDMEGATAAIADIVSRDINQGQGPDTVKRVAALRLNIIIPRDFVRATMHGLVGQGPSDLRRPGRRSGPKKRGALDAIGIFQEIHADGHEKVGEKALRMGAGIGIDIYGMRDHVGKLLWMVAVPNSRLSDTIGHVFLDMVSKYGAISVQVTFDGGSKLGWLSAFQTTLRETFAPELSTAEWPACVAVQSSINIPIESTWSYDRKFNGRTLREILEEASGKAGRRIHLIPGDLIHRHLFLWLWSKIVQISLDEFVDYFNNKKTRRQRARILPSGVAPNVVFDMPQDYGLENLAIAVPQAAIDQLRDLIDTPRSEALRWVLDVFDAVAREVYARLGSPGLQVLTGWAIFNAMAPLLRQEFNCNGLYDALYV
ncbi:hypothetical protein R3P38DRAFT_3412060 [Favolaschia claudopus]|uniref:Uncharacterized protein n=1 Tax=Favolaschia claudopus TaxID=2862362 RepID=A0AAV9Z9M3_9AGAR